MATQSTRIFSAKKNGTTTRPKITISSNEIILIVLIIGLLLGTIAGSAQCLLLEKSQYAKLSGYLGGFFNTINPSQINRYDVFFECMIKYGKILLIIWFLAFLPLSCIFSVIVIFIKGMSCSFTTAFLIKEFGMQGFYYAVSLYLPQSLIIVPAYIFVAHAGIKFFILQIQTRKIQQCKDAFLSRRHVKIKFRDLFYAPVFIEKKTFVDYLIVFVMGIFCIVAASLIESFIIPIFVAGF